MGPTPAPCRAPCAPAHPAPPAPQVYFENYGRYDWTRYFGCDLGLDLRWTAAKHRMWKARFAAMGKSRRRPNTPEPGLDAARHPCLPP